jgi:hypothetical protein
MGNEESGLTMAMDPSAPSTPPSPDATAGRSLRLWGVLVLVMFLLTSAVGGSLALEGSYLLVTLTSHIGLALVTLAIAGYSASFVGRCYRASARASAGIAALAALGATIAGTAFLLGGQSNAALYAMEVFAGFGILAAIVMIVIGGPSGIHSPVATSH